MGHDEVEVGISMSIHFFSRFLPRLKRGSTEVDLAKVASVLTPEPSASNYEKLRKQGSELLDLGKPEDAVLVFETAFQTSPSAEAHLNLGYAMLEANRTSEAKRHFEHAARLDPSNFDAHLLIATVAAAEPNHEVAHAAIKSAIAINPESDVATNLLYRLFATQEQFQKIEDHVTLQSKGTKSTSEVKVDVAKALMNITAEGELKKTLLASASLHLQAAIELNPNNPYAFYEKGRLLLLKSGAALAVQSFEKAIAIDSTFVVFHYWLAIAHKTLGNRSLAAASAEKAVSTNPKYIETYKLLAEICLDNSDHIGAEAYCKKVIDIEPNAPEALLILGRIYVDTGQPQRAIDVSRQAVSLRQNSAEVHFALGNILSSQHFFAEAADSYRRALQLRPNYFDASNNLASTLLSMGNNEEALAMYQAIVKDDPEHAVGLQNIAFCLSFDPSCTPTEYLAIARKFGVVASAKAKPFTSWIQKPLNDRPLKVGLVSGDLRLHPVGLFLESVLTYFDIEKIEIHAFSNLTTFDALQVSLKSRVNKWVSIAGIPDEAAAKLIHDSELDLLLDLSGHTGAGRCALFAWRAAPVQAAWLGYWASTGVTEIDYVLSDRHSVLPEHQDHFSEKVWYMADTRLCFTPPSAIYKIVPGPCPAVRLGHVTFGCFQSIRKLNKNVFALWLRIHQRLPSALFRVQAGGLDNVEIRTELLKRMTDAGLPNECVSLHGSMPGLAYLKAHDEVDIILDTFPFPGGTTTCEALWMSVPTVTFAGDTMVSRQGVSLLTYAGLADWIANTEDEYVDIAVKKASDIKQLGRLRAVLRQQVFESALFNAPRFASNLEDTLRDMVLYKQPHLGLVMRTDKSI